MLFLIILILSLISSYFLPWWFVAVIAFLAAFFMGKASARPFLSGFTAVFVAWAVLALFKTIPNDNLLAKKVAVLFPLGGNWIFILLITAIVGGLVGGMAALSGVLVKKAFGK